MKKLVPVIFFTSVMKDACLNRRTCTYVQMKLLITLIIQFSVLFLISAGDVDFMTDSSYSQVAVKRDKRAQRERPTCTQPPVTPDKNYLVRFSLKDELASAKPEQIVPENAIISFQCNKGYALDYESGESHEAASICKNNSWQPPILKCRRICLNFSNFRNSNMTCYQYLGGPQIPCTGLLLEGAIVKPRCRQKFHPNRNVDYDYATCQEDGNWDKEFFNCIPECGAVASSIVSLIANGDIEKRGGAPWNLVIYSKQRSPQKPEFICGATLINEELAISAAHCFYDDIFHQKLDIGLFYASVAKATPDFNVTDYPGITKTYRLKNIYFPDVITFEGATTNYAGDIVILQLSEKVTFSPDVFPACLYWDQTDRFYPGENITGKLSGFGAKADKSFPSVLLTANLPYIGYDECKKRVRNDFRTSISTDKFCAGSEKGTGARRGDSGGGLLFMDDATGLYHLRGVVSNKDLSESSSIATFTDIAQYVSWILKIVRTLENESKSCQCNPDGSLSSSCDSQTGNCQCKKFVTGKKCDTCKDGYFSLSSKNPDGCLDAAKWVKFSPGKICLNAAILQNATDESDTLLIARHQLTHKLASIPRSENTTKFSEYEVLCNDSLKWVEGAAGPEFHGGIVSRREDINDPYSVAYYLCQAFAKNGEDAFFGEMQPNGDCLIGDQYQRAPPGAFSYMVSTNATDGPKWVKFSHGKKCSNAVEVNYDLEGPLLAVRHRIDLFTESGESSSIYKLVYRWYIIEKKHFYVGKDSQEPPPDEYEVLCGDSGWDWIFSLEDAVPPGAVVHRLHPMHTNARYYVCRALADDGSMIVGEISSRANYCLISHRGREIRRLGNQYDVLAQSG